ncbi:MAG TPA: sigma-70 family RNA polymerase sigma factor [Candidatus Micrarchaeia archaeon]|nr:sigma-70 family RNA polymerase sigma factor [Candidatus Micrarchaeia archaeon]
MDAAAYRPGSAADFDRLYRATRDRLLHTLLGVLSDRDAAEDCVQETFVRALGVWDRWRPDAPAEAWLHRIALNVAISHRRREKIRGVGELVRRMGRPQSPPDPADGVGAEVLLQALRTLPPKQAAAIVLRHHHGYSNREIAVALGVPERTIASRLAAARGRLAAELGAGAIEAGGQSSARSGASVQPVAGRVTEEPAR